MANPLAPWGLQVSTLTRIIFDPDTTAPLTPGGVTASALSQTAIHVAWNATTDTGGSGLAGYKVYRATATSGPYTLLTALTVASLSYDDTSLSAGQTRFYKISAFDGNANESAQSAAASATTQSSSSSIFREDFEAYSVGATVNGAIPAIRISPSAWAATSGPVTIVGTGLNSSRALQFSYPVGNMMAEQRYVLDTTGTKQYAELWAEFDLFIPANWVPPGSLNNNKTFFFYNDDTGNTSYFDFENYKYLVDPVNNPSNFTGVYIQHQMKRDGVNVAGGFINADNGNGHGELYPFINAVTDPGRWIHYGFHVRMDQQASYAAGTPTSQRGVVEVFKDGLQIWRRVSETGTAGTTGSPLPRYNSFNTGTNAAGVSNTHMSGGYILGNANATYTVLTNYLLDNFNVTNVNPGWGN